MKNNKLKYVILGIIILLVVGSLVFFALKDTFIKYVIQNADKTNSMFERKIARINTIPIELLFSSLIFLFIYCVIDNKDRIKRWVKRLNNKKVFTIVFSILVIFNLIFGIYLIFHHRISTDEAVQIYAAKSVVLEHKMLYKDFAYFKQPFLPVLMGVPLLFLGFSIVGERVLALLLKLVFLGLIYLVTTKIAKTKWAGLLAIFIATMSFSSMNNFTTIDNAGLIPTILLLLALYSLISMKETVLTTLLLCTSIATRIFIGPLALLLLFYYKGKERLKCFLTGLAFILVVYIPLFLVSGFKRVSFSMFGIGLNRATLILPYREINYFFGIVAASSIIDKLVNILFIFLHHWLIFLTVGILVILYWKKVKKEKLLLFLLASFIILMTIILIPSPTGACYTFQFIPLGIILTSTLFIKYVKRPYIWVVFVLLILLLPLFQYPRFLYEYRDEKKINTINDLHRMSDIIKQLTKEGDYILGFEIPIIVEANREPLPGLERGSYSFFPYISREEANELGIANIDIYLDYLNNRNASLFIASQRRTIDVLNLLPGGYRKEINEAITNNYIPIGKIANVSDWGDVYIFKRK